MTCPDLTHGNLPGLTVPSPPSVSAAAQPGAGCRRHAAVVPHAVPRLPPGQEGPRALHLLRREEMLGGQEHIGRSAGWLTEPRCCGGWRALPAVEWLLQLSGSLVDALRCPCRAAVVEYRKGVATGRAEYRSALEACVSVLRAMSPTRPHQAMVPVCATLCCRLAGGMMNGALGCAVAWWTSFPVIRRFMLPVHSCYDTTFCVTLL